MLVSVENLMAFAFPVLRYGKVGWRDVHSFRKVAQGDFAFCHHNVEIYNNRHDFNVRWLILVPLSSQVLCSKSGP